MKKTALVLALSAMLSTTAFAHESVSAPTLSAGAAGAAGVIAQVNGSSSAGLNGGSSQSGAQSLQTATIAVTSGTNIPGGNINGAQSAVIGAAGTTASQGFAYNLSTGAATGAATMYGNASQQAVGAATTQQVGSAGSPASPATGWPFPQGSGPCVIGCNSATPATAPSASYIPSGTASGNEASSTNQYIQAGANQGEAVAGVSGGNFGANVGFTTNNQDVSVPATGNTVTTQSGQGLQLTAGAIGGTYSQTATTNGVYQDGSNIVFGGASNYVPATSSVNVNNAVGSFGAQSSINGVTSTGATLANAPL